MFAKTNLRRVQLFKTVSRKNLNNGNSMVLLICEKFLQVTVASLSGPQFDAFLKEIPQNMMKPPWNYNGTVEEGKRVSIISVATSATSTNTATATNTTNTITATTATTITTATNTTSKIDAVASVDIATTATTIITTTATITTTTTTTTTTTILQPLLALVPLPLLHLTLLPPSYNY